MRSWIRAYEVYELKVEMLSKFSRYVYSIAANPRFRFPSRFISNWWKLFTVWLLPETFLLSTFSLWGWLYTYMHWRKVELFMLSIGIPRHIDVLMVMQETIELYSCYLFLFLILGFCLEIYQGNGCRMLLNDTHIYI